MESLSILMCLRDKLEIQGSSFRRAQFRLVSFDTVLRANHALRKRGWLVYNGRASVVFGESNDASSDAPSITSWNNENGSRSHACCSGVSELKPSTAITAPTALCARTERRVGRERRSGQRRTAHVSSRATKLGRESSAGGVAAFIEIGRVQQTLAIDDIGARTDRW
jgi:hypothetical protein